MFFFLIAIVILSVLFFGGVNYWAVALVNLAAAAALITFLVSGLKKKSLEISKTSLYVPIIVAVTLALFHLYSSNIFIYARKEFLYVSALASLFFVAFNLLKTPKELNRLVIFIIFVSVPLAGYGIFQFYLSPDRTFNVIKPPEYWGRASGTFISPNHYGGYLAVALPLILCLCIDAFAAARSMTRKIFSLAAFGIVFSGLLFSFSRGAITAFGISVIFVFCLLIKRRLIKPRFIPIAVLLFVPMIVFSAARDFGGKGRTAAGDSARIEVIKDSLSMVNDRPVVGHGAGSFRWIFPQYKREGIRRVVDFAHNDYLQIAAEAGILGLIVFLSIIFLVFRKGLFAVLRGDPENVFMATGLMGGLLAGLSQAVVDFNLHITANAVLMTVFAAGVCAVCKMDKRSHFVFPLYGEIARTAAWVLAFLFFLMIIYNGKLIGSAFYFYRGENQTRQLLWDEALASYRRGFALDPKNPIIAGKIADLNYKKYIFSRTERDLLRDEAAAWYNIAAGLNPYDGDIKVRMADLYQNIGETEKARTELDGAVALDPNNGYFHRMLGNYFLRRKEFSKAAAEFERTLRIYPKDEIAKALLKKAKKEK